MLAVTVLAAITTTGLAAGIAAEPGVMLRNGNYAGHGAYMLPQALAKVQPALWPTSGWYRLSIQKDGIESSAVAAPGRDMPAFLVPIAAQAHRAQFDSGEWVPDMIDPGSQDAPVYLRIPDTAVRTGLLPFYRFKNGTSGITPILDHTYTLSFQGQPFIFSVRNGFRTKDGRAYGEGAQYTIEYDGQKYEYSLGTQGWDSRILAITDMDSDGRPDFHIAVGDGSEYILLSSRAKPGRNPPSASLASTGGC